MCRELMYIGGLDKDMLGVVWQGRIQGGTPKYHKEEKKHHAHARKYPAF